MIKIAGFQNAVEHGKWFTFDTDHGTLKLLIVPMLPADIAESARKYEESGGNLEKGLQMIREVCSGQIRDWEGIADQNDKEIPYSPDLLLDDAFFYAFSSLLVKHGEAPPSKLSEEIIKIIHDPSFFIGGNSSGDPSKSI